MSFFFFLYYSLGLRLNLLDLDHGDGSVRAEIEDGTPSRPLSAAGRRLDRLAALGDRQAVRDAHPHQAVEVLCGARRTGQVLVR